MGRTLIGAAIGAAAYAAWQKSRGNGGGLTTGLLQPSDPRMWLAIAAGALAAHAIHFAAVVDV
jgi:hypothetical protein